MVGISMLGNKSTLTLLKHITPTVITAAIRMVMKAGYLTEKLGKAL